MPADTVPPWARLRGIANVFIQSQALYTAARLGVADVLAAGPLPTAELAAQVHAQPDRLARVMRLLAIEDIFEESSPGVWANNEVSVLLRQEPGKASGRDMVMHLGDETYRGFTTLSDSVLLSHPGIAFEDVSGGQDYWNWLSLPQNQEVQARFDRAMTAGSAGSIPAILKDYDWSRHASATVADVGGGVGHVLAALLRAHPEMQGVLFDRPPVMERAQELWQQQHGAVAPRAQLVAGDMFESVPPADVYFLKHIIHDWDDAPSIKILQAIRRCAAPGARVLLCETVVPDAAAPSWMARMDLLMMVMVGGKERTADQWRDLLAAAGFTMQEVVPLSSGQSIIVAA